MKERLTSRTAMMSGKQQQKEEERFSLPCLYLSSAWPRGFQDQRLGKSGLSGWRRYDGDGLLHQVDYRRMAFGLFFF